MFAGEPETTRTRKWLSAIRNHIWTVILLGILALFIGFCVRGIERGPATGPVLNERMGDFCLAVLDWVSEEGPDVLPDDIWAKYMAACNAWADWSEDKYPGASSNPLQR